MRRSSRTFQLRTAVSYTSSRARSWLDRTHGFSRPPRWVGWINPSSEGTASFRSGVASRESEYSSYAGEPTHDPVVAHGPFIGDTQEDIVRLYGEYEAGQFPKMSDLAASLVPST